MRKLNSCCILYSYVREKHGLEAPLGSWSQSWGWPSAGGALTHRAQSHGAGDRVHQQTPTQQMMNGARAQTGAAARSKRRWRQRWGWRLAVSHHHWGRDWCHQGAAMASWTMSRVRWAPRETGQGQSLMLLPSGPWEIFIAWLLKLSVMKYNNLVVAVIFISLYHLHRLTDNDLFQD